MAYTIEFRIPVALGALSDSKLSGSGTKTSGIYPIFRTSVGSLFTLGYRIVPAQGLLFFEKMVHRFCLIRYAWLNFFEVSGSTCGKICAHELFNIGHPIQSLHSWWLFIIPFASSKPQTRLEGAVWVQVQIVDPIKKDPEIWEIPMDDVQLMKYLWFVKKLDSGPLYQVRMAY